VGDLRTAPGLLALMAMPGIGAGSAIALAEAFPTLEALRGSSPAERRKAAGTRGAELDPDRVRIDQPEQEGTLSYFDATFPGRLRHIPSPPAVLWVRGNLPNPEAPAIAVVGTREPTAWGVRTAERSVEALQGTDAVIVSGLALGVDGVAHRRALDVGLPTVAVLGSGVDVPTPAAHRDLARQILHDGGALVSEVPLGTTPSARTLVARNRLQSGFADAVVVAQCGLGSGTLHTARFCLLQGRILIVPEPTGAFASEPQCGGNIALVHTNDAGVIKASPAEAKRLASRSRHADRAPIDAGELESVLQQIVHRRDQPKSPEGSVTEQLHLE
jgi:DNA processing protein